MERNRRKGTGNKGKNGGFENMEKSIFNETLYKKIFKRELVFLSVAVICNTISVLMGFKLSIIILSVLILVNGISVCFALANNNTWDWFVRYQIWNRLESVGNVRYGNCEVTHKVETTELDNGITISKVYALKYVRNGVNVVCSGPVRITRTRSKDSRGLFFGYSIQVDNLINKRSMFSDEIKSPILAIPADYDELSTDFMNKYERYTDIVEYEEGARNRLRPGLVYWREPEKLVNHVVMVDKSGDLAIEPYKDRFFLTDYMMDFTHMVSQVILGTGIKDMVFVVDNEHITVYIPCEQFESNLGVAYDVMEEQVDMLIKYMNKGLYD